MEHSRLLKFLTEERYKTIMAEPPSYKIKKDYESPPNISAEVPGEQKIREIDSNYQESTVDTSTEVTDTEYTLSPVITVTKNETTLTKGDLKLQKVTVSEDIAPHDVENGGYRVSYAGLQTTIETDRQTVRRTVSATERVFDTEDKNHDQKKSRIPQKKFKKTVEKVQKEMQEQTTDNQPQNTRRRSSIPKLKDAKAVKRRTSLKAEHKVEDEFDRIYEEIVLNKQNNVDEKLLAQKMDDVAKVESIFDEIIHAYDSNDDSYLTPTEKLRLSKIPFKNKDKTASKMVTADKKKKSEANSNLKDGGFKVSATTIKTKRFSRGNSMDWAKIQKLNQVETSDNQNGRDKEVIEETITIENVESNPRKIKTTVHTINRAPSLVETSGIEIIKKVEDSQNYTEDVFEIEDSEVSRKFNKERTTRIPIKPERINRSISRELNRRPAKLDDRDFVNREVVKYEEYHDGTSKTKTSKEPEIRTEKVTRSISRSFSRDGKSITVSPKSKLTYNYEDKTPRKETTPKGSSESDMAKTISSHDLKLQVKQNVFKAERNTKLPTPVIAKTTHSYSIGRVQNVERSRSIEWKSSNEVLTKNYVRSYSEKRNTQQNIGYQKDEFTVAEKGITHSKLIDIDSENIDRHVLNDVDNTKVIVSEDQAVIVTLNNLEVTKETTAKPSEISTNYGEPLHKEINDNDSVTVQNKDSDVKNVTVLKGNVNRLISQISVNDSTDVPKKDIDIKGDLPKKKTVLSKIAMFEGKEPAEVTIKIKKYTLDKIAAPLAKTDIEETTRRYTDTPVIVDQIWKFEEQNISSMHQVVNVEVLPGAIDFTISENSVEKPETSPNQPETETLPAEITVKINEHRIEHSRLFPETLGFVPYEKPIVNTQKLPGQINFETNESPAETVTTVPANVNFISNKNESTIVKFAAEKSITKKSDPPLGVQKPEAQKPEVQKPKVGKLNFDLWNKQVQVNKQLVGKGKHIKPNETQITVPKIINTKTIYKTESSENEVFKSMPPEIDSKIDVQNEKEAPLSLPNKVDYAIVISKDEEPVSLPRKIRIKSEGYYEMPTILPAKSEFTSSVSLNELPKISPERINFTSKDGQLHVPVVLPETPLTKSAKNNFDFKRNRTDVSPSYLCKTPVNTPEISSTIPYFTINTNTAEVSKTLLGQINLKLENNKTITNTSIVNNNNNSLYNDDTNQALSKTIDTKTDEPSRETPRILREQIDFNPNSNSVEVTRPLPKTIEVNAYEKTAQFEGKFTENNNYIDDLDKEIPSDPELVDSEPEIRDSKGTILGRLQNKLFLITNRNVNRNIAAKLKENSLSTSPDIDEFDTVSNHTSLPINNNLVRNLQDSTRNRNDFDFKTNIVQKSVYDFEAERNAYSLKEDMKRTISLAELDLGDAVKGQVQRMVYRIKSVDFGKMEAARSRKISLREMPKKCSVLEKIALFEGKATITTTTAAPKTRQIVVTTPPSTTTGLVNLTQTAEEIYLRRIEELSTAKIRYNKTDTLFLKLGNGDQMPAIGFGTAMLDPRIGPHVVAAAIDLGYRAYDTAYVYGTERTVGQGIKTKIDDGTVTRDDLFIMGKLWSTFHKPELVEPACRASLEALGLEYFDLYMIHNPISLKDGIYFIGIQGKEGADAVPQIANVLQFSQHDYLDAWFAMETLVSKGLVKALGVSNFNAQQIQKIIDKGHIKPMVNQVECHPYLTQQPLHNFCKERNITLSCYSCLGSKGTPAEYKTGLEAAIDDPLIKVMASGLNVTPAQLLIRYQIQSGRQAILKASSPGHLWDNLQAFTFVLEPHHIAAIEALNRNRRMFDLKMFGEFHKNYPFSAPF